MSLPGVIVNQLDGNLGLSSGSPSQTAVLIGCCTGGTAATLYSVGSSQQAVSSLGAGKLAEDACYLLSLAGGSHYFMPVAPSVAGAIASPTHVGTGSGTMTVSAAPHAAVSIVIKSSTTFTWQVGSGAISAPVTIPNGSTFAVPGTYCIATFPSGTYVANDTFTIATTGGVAHTGTGVALVTQASSPLDDYALVVAMTTGGANGTAAFTYSLDGGLDTSSPIVTPGGGVYSIPNSGLVLTFASTQTAGDVWTAQCAAPSFSGTDLAACLTALQTTYLGTAQYALAYVDRYATSAAAAVTEVSTLQTYALAMKNQGVYVRALGAFPSVGSINISAGAVSIDVADTDSVVEAAVLSVVAEHVGMAGGDCSITLPNSGLTLRRSAGLVAITRALQFEASANIGAVGNGGVNVAGIYRDENATPGLDAARLITLRTFPNAPGVYLTDGHTLALPTSDYAPLANARVVDRACTIARAQAMPLVQGKLETSPKIPGAISEKRAQKLDARMTSAMKTSLVDTSPADAVDAKATTDRQHNVLSDGNVIIAVGVEPYAYGKTITVNIALQPTL